MKSIFAFFMLTILSANLNASDHIDGAPTLSNGQADLSDLYAFPTPERPESLTVVLNTYPGVETSGHFSKKVKYAIEMRQATLNSPTQQGFHVFSFDVLTLSCAFSDPGHHHGNSDASQGQATCQLLKDQEVVSEVNGSVGQVIENENLKVFTGLRADAFFLSVPHFQKMTKRQGYPPQDPDAKNGMYTINVLSIVAEIKVPELQVEPELMAVSAQSLDAETNVAIDRVGRPEITNLSLHAHDDAEPLKRGYNKKPQFAVAKEFQEVYQQRLLDNITAYDKLDNSVDWNDEDLQTFSGILVEDYLVLNMKGACLPEVTNFLAIEKSLITDTTTTSCGGRRITDDIMAILSGYYIAGIDADYKDFLTGVNEPYQSNDKAELSAEFPYLAPAGKTSWLQKQLLKLLIYTQE